MGKNIPDQGSLYPESGLAISWTLYIRGTWAYGTMPEQRCARHHHTMNNLLNIIIVLLIVGWLIGFIGFGAMVGSLIHILLVLALIGLVYRLFAGGRNKA